jgi:hypothetical protein
LLTSSPTQLLELTLPLAFIGVLIAIKNSVADNENFKTVLHNAIIPKNFDAFTPLSFRDYVTAMQAKHICIGRPEDLFEISGIPSQGYNWQVPLVKCDSGKCRENGEDAERYCTYSLIALTGSDAGGKARAKNFEEWLYRRYPALTNMSFVDFKKITKIFPNSNAINDYVKDKDYGKTGRPKIAMGIVWEGDNKDNYIYRLRQNSTNVSSRPPPCSCFIADFSLTTL